MTARPFYSYYFFLSIAFLIGGIATLSLGEIPWSEISRSLPQRLFGGSTQWNALLDERLPRLLILSCTGASLAVSGAVMQSLFQNPLASPSILGITCGGGLMVTLVFIMEWHHTYPFAVPIAAFTGCVLTFLVVYSIARHIGGHQRMALILTGIAVSTLLLAIQSGITYALRDRWQLIQTLTEWEVGSTANRSWKHVHLQLPLTLVGLLGCWRYSKEIDILALGEEEATNLGVDTKTVRWRLFLCVSLLTGGALAAVGIIAFFGLVLPHVIRRLFGSCHHLLIPHSMLLGATTLIALDVIMRYFHLHFFSIGNISAILGGVFFLSLLVKRPNYGFSS